MTLICLMRAARFRGLERVTLWLLFAKISKILKTGFLSLLPHSDCTVFLSCLKKILNFFFYLGLHNGHGCFWPNFHIHNLFRFVSAAVRTQKTKIFPFSKNMQIWDTLKGFGWPRMMETQYSRVLGPQKNFHHFWEHWPAHFFTTWWMRSKNSLVLDLI